MKNLLESLNPPVSKLLEDYADKYPYSGSIIKDELSSHKYVANLRYGIIWELLLIAKTKQGTSPYDLFNIESEII